MCARRSLPQLVGPGATDSSGRGHANIGSPLAIPWLTTDPPDKLPPSSVPTLRVCSFHSGWSGLLFYSLAVFLCLDQGVRFRRFQKVQKLVLTTNQSLRARVRLVFVCLDLVSRVGSKRSKVYLSPYTSWGRRQLRTHTVL